MMPRIAFPLLLSALALVLILSGSACGNPPFAQGQKLYALHCESCHMDDGTGLGGNIPPLARSDYLADHQDILGCLIRYGQQDTIIVNGRSYSEVMPGVPDLTEFQIANIINYINQAWGNDYGFIKVEDLRRQLDDCGR